MSADREREMLREALQRNPSARIVRRRLAMLLAQLDAFEEAVELLTSPDCGEPGVEELRILAWAHFALGASHDRLSLEASERALAAAATDVDRSLALTDQAKVLRRLGKTHAARERLQSALELDPHNDEACERLAASLLKLCEGGAIIALTDTLAAQGVAHTRLLAARMAAFAQMGQVDQARETVNLAAFLYHQPISPPPGWDDLAAFNAAIADEVLSRPELRYNRHGTASENTWRVDSPAVGAAPAVRALLALIAETAERHSARLSPHPWVTARPQQAALRSWCVITRADGFEQWHLHPVGWMSGGYYVEVPRAVEDGDDERGCLAFGLSPSMVGEAAARAFGEQRIRPRAGSLTLFPSHACHRTYPHGDNGQRICIAFDIYAHERASDPPGS